MPGRAQQLFSELIDASAVLSLIGEHEDAYLDCKEWHPKNSSPEVMLAKGVSGLTNAEGGVLVIGMKAQSKPKDEPDVIECAVPVPDTKLVKSRILDLVGKNVEPGVVGIEAREIGYGDSETSGFVILYVPPSNGVPRRSRVDWKFYLRIGSGTFPMEYFQLEERFGLRPRPKLELSLEAEPDIDTEAYLARVPIRTFTLSLTNVGQGIAKFPCIRFARENGLIPKQFGLDGNGSVGLPRSGTESSVFSFRGGVNEVIYPGETLKITKVYQASLDKGLEGIPRTAAIWSSHRGTSHTLWYFGPIDFNCQISSEGAETIVAKVPIAEFKHIVKN